MNTSIRKELDNLKHNPILLKYPINKREVIIRECKKTGIEILKNSDLLLAADKNDLIDYIIKLPGYDAWIKPVEKPKFKS